MKLRVLGRVTSINVRKVLWLLDELGVSYEREDWGLPIRDPRVPEFLTLNPNAQVPVIVDDGFVLWESNVILRYLGEKHESELWPTDRRERALVDQWMSWQATELNPTWGYAVQALLRRSPAFDDGEETHKSIDRWTAAMKTLDDALEAGRGYAANGRFSLADIVLALSTHRWMVTPFDRPRLGAVEAHYSLMRSRAPGAAYLGSSTP
jgi:glutathione S-transferase